MVGRYRISRKVTLSIDELSSCLGSLRVQNRAACSVPEQETGEAGKIKKKIGCDSMHKSCTISRQMLKSQHGVGRDAKFHP